MLPGGVGISRLCVYDTTGSPHIHLACAEAYVVTGGRGAVQTLTQDGFAEHELTPGGLLTFTPGTVHRLVNGGGLEIIVLMANSGLPEAGDAVLTFPSDVLADPERYAEAATLDGTERSAFRRRDLAVAGFEELRAKGPAGLTAFHEAAVKLKQPQLDAWRTRWEAGALHAARETGEQLDALRRGDPSHLAAAHVTALPGPTERGRLGMCGTLDVYRQG
jgi:mannose-6-phosphate isomerase-like protein (cupin superfamily)